MSMSDLLDIDDEADLITTLGDPATNNGQAISLIIEHGLQDVTIQDAYTTTPSLSVVGLKRDLPGVKRGSRITHLGKTLIVDAITAETPIHVTLVARYA